MADKSNSSLKQKLSQNLSTWQIQVMNMVMLPQMELADRVKQELIENPALEEGHPEGEPDGESADQSDPDLTSDELSLGDYASEDDVPDATLRRYYEGQKTASEIPFAEEQSLQEALNDQLPLTPLSEEDQVLASFLVGSLDEDGYLRRTLVGISDDLAIYRGLEVSEQKLQDLLSVIQTLDPPGVGARNLQECLLLQVRRLPSSPDHALAEQLLEHYFDELGKKQLQHIEEETGASDDQLRAALQVITRLNPTPGLDFSSKLQDTLMTITPDFEVREHDGDLHVTLYSGGIPEVRVSPEFEEQFRRCESDQPKNKETRKANQFIKQKLNEARGFVELIKQRNNTMLTTMTEIVNLQRDYFLTGDINQLRPMILQDVADRIGYDVSTISRVTSNKYVETDFGIVPLRRLFSEAIVREDGEMVTTQSVKHLVKQLIDEEDKQNPLSDEALREALKEHGFDVARRTVAKYRSTMGIPIARLRKDW